ncbi:MAG: OmpA family protein, partial [Planctomycetota bacterium]
DSAALSEMVRAEDIERLQPHDEVRQPRIATFAADSANLDGSSRRYIDALVDTLRPRGDQVLNLEGHANDADRRFGRDDARLAFARARAVADYLVREHGFDPDRLHARAWLSEVTNDEAAARGVDARLVIPADASR